ncbi:hypothetical protein [Cellulosilyticum sp. I15G10I2]|uniref:hypothetical protein n=1 Tax=Cellulosilyticum sp. I15G10I2 TaxID=1892843 RepID=UPI00085C679B|nr:hypothetical protein [Cellulosilyticum sp. I15G10I2]
MCHLKGWIILILSFSLIMPSNITAAMRNTKLLKAQQNATWLWHTEQIVQNPDQIIAFLLKQNINQLYLQVDYDLELEQYKSFIKKASNEGIEIHALEGAPEWVSDKGEVSQNLFFNWLTKYQEDAEADEKFKGVHLDIEPYLNLTYCIDKNMILERYQKLLLDAANRCSVINLKLAVDIPFWFDEVVYATQYGEGILAEWIINHIKYVVIMAYRDTAWGENGIIKLVSNEIEYAKAYGCMITIAVETQQSCEGDFVSFYEEGQSCMNNELSLVYKHYKDSSSFDGFAVHHIMSWMHLKI